MDSPVRLYFIRHAEVEEKYHRVFGGRIDMGISPLGRQQALALADYLERVPFEALYASPMRRVQETLQKLSERQNRKPIILDELREVDFGAWTGLGWDEVQARFGVSAFTWLEQLEHGAINGAEPADQFRIRIESALREVLGNCPGRTVAIICHGGVIRMALSILLELPLKKMAAFDFEYASLSIVDWLPRKAEVQLLNLTPWRDSA
jgi:broad specificity phosphatase PhoE